MGPLLCRRPLFVGAAVFVLGAALLVTAGLARAQTPPSPGSARGLTQSLVALDAQYRAAGPARRAQLVSHLLSVAATRQQVLLSLVESDPGEVLRVALPANLRAGMASSIQSHLEKEVDLDGVLEVLHEDHANGSRYFYFLETRTERLSLHFATDPPGLPARSHVRVRGVRVGQMLALASGTTSVQTLAAALPNTFGAKSTVVLLVNFQNNPIQPYTVDYARSVVFTTTSNFFMENSSQQTWLTGNVYGWYTLPLSSTVCDGFQIRDYAKAAATAAGVDLSPYSTFVYAFPTNSGCGYSGMAQIGGPNVWINGNLELNVVGHELGHVLGLYHSHALECGATTNGTNCSVWEYGDVLDIMGNTSAGHFNAFQKERLGWLGGDVATVGANGVYTLDLYEAPLGVQPKALKNVKSTDSTTGQKTWYFVEFRQAIGFDSFVATKSNVLSGVVIHTGSDGDINSSMLLDMTPVSSALPDVDWNDPALTVGRSFSDSTAGVTITLTSAGSTGAAVSVSLASPTCTHANPTVTISPSQSQWVPAGTAVTYTVSVTNQDNASCTASTFNLQATAPAGWTSTFSPSTLTLSPGASGSASLQVTSSTSAANAFYTIAASATNGAAQSETSTVSATYVVVASMSVSVATDKPSYAKTQTVTITAVVSSAGSPVGGASVSFNVTKPGGTVVAMTATTGTNGAAVVTLRIKPKDPTGAYGVRAGATSGSATTNFMVQ